MVKLLKKIRFVQVFWFFFFLFLFFLILRNSLNYLDPDLGWHLKVGQEISQTLAVPHANHYNYTFTGNWVDHEWLADFLMYEIYSRAGYLALNVIFSLLSLLTLIILAVFARRAWPGKSPAGALALFLFLGTLASLPHWGVRVQVVAPLFLLLVLIIIHSYNRTGRVRRLLWLWPLFFFWASLHASFLFGLFILFAWAGVKVVEKLGQKWRPATKLDFRRILPSRKIVVFLLFALAAAGITMLTPYKFELYSFLSTYGQTFFMAHIQEWQSQITFPLFYWQLLYLVLAVAALSAYFYYGLKKKYFSLDLWKIFLLFLLFLMAFKSRRNFPLLFVSSLGFLTAVFASLFTWPAGPRLLSGRRFGDRFWLGFCLVVCLFLAVAGEAVKTNVFSDPFLFFGADYPRDAVDFLKIRGEYASAKLFNEYRWGGYLIWTDSERKLFIDGRLPQVGFAGHSFLEEYLEFFDSEAMAEEKLSQYDIKLVLLTAIDKPPEIKPWGKKANYLRSYLDNSQAWALIFKDKTSVIYARK